MVAFLVVHGCPLRGGLLQRPGPLWGVVLMGWELALATGETWVRRKPLRERLNSSSTPADYSTPGRFAWSRCLSVVFLR